MTIRDWVTQTFSSSSEPKLFLELGAHQGEDTKWMAEIPGVKLIAVEPDPRNCKHGFLEKGNVTFMRAAIGDKSGLAQFTPSARGWGRNDWTYSGSLLKPKTHIKRYPSVTFGEPITVQVVTVDTLVGLIDNHIVPPMVDFIWCDIQGSEGAMIRGGQETLKRTRYLYMEYSNEELYEGQETLGGCLSLLPGDSPFTHRSAWKPLHIWPDKDGMNGNILLENCTLAAKLATKKNLDPSEVCA